MSFPSYEMPSAKGPGILYVNSKITDRALSTDLFTKWYEEVHIPDIFETGGIKTAFRYYSTNGDGVERPYLALYPVKDVAFLQSNEFLSIPVHSTILPGTQAIFDLADFDTRYYSYLGTVKKNESGIGPAPSVTTICFDVEGGEEGAWSVVKTGILPIHEDIVRKVTLWSNFFGRQNRNRTADKKLADPPKFLAVVELNKSPTGDVSGQRSELSNEVTASFDLLKASGVGNSVSFE